MLVDGGKVRRTRNANREDRMYGTCMWGEVTAHSEGGMGGGEASKSK